MGYINSKKLECTWGRWLKTNSRNSWRELSQGVYKVCGGVVTQFHPRSEDEQNELVHHAFVLTMTKIKDRRLIFTPGRAPVFNFLTTAIFRCLYSLKTTEKRRKMKLVRYGQQAIQNVRIKKPKIC